jgi:hypothetical protein
MVNKMAQSEYRFKQISFNELPKFSEWPERLLSPELLQFKPKTTEEVTREFEHEKWGKLLEQVTLTPSTNVRQLEELSSDFNSRIPCIIDGDFALGTGLEVLDYQIGLIHSVIKPHLGEASALVELGAGFGSKILGMAERFDLGTIPLVAAEYTASGVKLIKRAAQSSGIEISVGRCDFRSASIDPHLVPEGAIIFTSYAAHYVPTYTSQFINHLIDMKPKVIIHFEPFYEHYALDNIHGLMCRRYVEVNDYTQNLGAMLDEGEHGGFVRITKVRKNIFGDNPFLPASIVEWVPVQN